MADVPDWVTLTEGEELVWQAKPSLLPYLTSLLGELILVALGLGIWFTGGVAFLIGLSFDPALAFLPLPFWTLVGLLLFAWGAFGIVSTGVRWWSNHYVVTTEEVYKKSGVISRTVRNTRLSEVQNTSFSQSFLGRLGSYGRVDVFTAGTAGREISFEYVKHPDAVVSEIAEQQSRSGP